MPKKSLFAPIGILLVLLLLVGSVSANLSVVSTTTVLWDPIQYIGGDKVEAIYVADPTICAHLQTDIINNRIQLERENIIHADLFIANNFTFDNPHVMRPVEDFMLANGYGEISWLTLKNPAMTWNSPTGAKLLSEEVLGWLMNADPGNASYYEQRYHDYLSLIDAADLSKEEQEKISGQDVIVMVWQKDAAEKWLGLNIVSIFAPEFYQGGKFTAVKLVDDINANPEKYKNVKYIIENMQSGEAGKGIEEALHDHKIPAERVIFTNFPKSIEGIDSIPEILAYNKELVTPGDLKPTPAQQAPPGTFISLGALIVVLLWTARSD
jgi:zinc/manganese transport system substrate-binding protein